MRNIRVGQIVAFSTVPKWVADLPPKTQQIFQFCRGKPYKVVDIDPNGLLVLDVSQDVDKKFGGRFNDLRIEPEHVEEIKPSRKTRAR